MKIRIALVENDKLYSQRLIASLNSRYFEKLTIYSFNSVESAQENLSMTKVDVVIASEMFDLSPLKRKNTAYAYFSSANDAISVKGERAIRKYQRVENIYKQILDLYSEIHVGSGVVLNSAEYSGIKVVGVFSIGGAGATAVSAAYARHLASQGETVLYLNLEKNNTSDLIFSGEGQSSFADIIYAVKSKNSNLSLKLESCVKRDSSGVYFYSPSAAILDFLELNEEEILEIVTAIKNTGKYTYIVVDFNFDFGSLSLKLMKMMYKSFVVVDEGESSVKKFKRMFESLSILEERDEVPYVEKMYTVYNKVSAAPQQSFTAELDELNIKLAGGIPYFGALPLKSVTEKISAMGMFANEQFK